MVSEAYTSLIPVSWGFRICLRSGGLGYYVVQSLRVLLAWWFRVAGGGCLIDLGFIRLVGLVMSRFGASALVWASCTGCKKQSAP